MTIFAVMMNKEEKRQTFKSLLILSSVIITFALISYLFFYFTAKKAIHSENYTDLIVQYADSLGFTHEEMTLIIQNLEVNNLQHALEVSQSDTLGNPWSRYKAFVECLGLPQNAQTPLLTKISTDTGNELIFQLLKIDKFLPEFFPEMKKELLIKLQNNNQL